MRNLILSVLVTAGVMLGGVSSFAEGQQPYQAPSVQNEVIDQESGINNSALEFQGEAGKNYQDTKEDCANGTDDDGDGKVDCADTDCANDPACTKK